MQKTIIFDGKAFAAEREEELAKKVQTLKVVPKLVSLLIGNDPASRIYTSLKKKAAKRVGIEFEVKNFGEDVEVEEVVQSIKVLNRDKSVHGIMVQLPLPANLKSKTRFVLYGIRLERDVDGLKKESPFVPAAVRAVIHILGEAPSLGKKAIVVGSKGFFGSKLVEKLKERDLRVLGVDKEDKNLKSKVEDADIVISAAGVPNLITGDMIKPGAVIIDLGAPKGDVDRASFTSVAGQASLITPGQASLITPVPGGVGPVTVVSLLETLVEAVVKSEE